MKHVQSLAFLALTLLPISCADDKPFLSGYIKRASAGLMTPCDPYNQDQTHTCIVYSTAFASRLVVYNASAEEMVLSPVRYFPLKVQVGPATNELVSVVSQNPRFPYILGLDGTTKSLYPIRVFPGADKKASFSTPEPQSIPNPSLKLAAYESGDKVFVLLVNESSIDFVRLDNKEGKRTMSVPQNIPLVGSRLSHIQIHEKGKKAFISDEGGTKMHVIDLANIAANMAAGTAPPITSHEIGIKIDKIYLSVRNLGLGEKPYLAALEASGKKLVLIDADADKVIAQAPLAESPLSGYFPTQSSEPCCDSKKDWLQVATVKGKILYYTIDNQAGILSLKLAKTIDLTSKQVLGVSNIHIRAMVGGPVAVDTSIKRESPCKNNRKVFLISSYASQDIIGHNGKEQVEIEAQCYACEGEDGARRLGAES